MISTKWLGTAAVALVIGTGAVIAQTQPEPSQKRDESPRAQAPSKDAERPAEQRQMDRTAQQPDAKGAAKDMKEPQRSEDKSAPQQKQAQEPLQGKDSKQPSKQTQDQQKSDQRPPTDAAQRPAEQKGREAKQPVDQKQQQTRDQQQKQDKSAQDAKPPADAKQQAQQPQQPQQPGRDQASQPAPAQKGDTAQDQRAPAPGQTTTQQSTQQPGAGATTSASVSEQQRTEIRERLSRDRASISRETQNLNIQVNIGTTLPPRVRPRPLPPEIVRIAPHYRGYSYTVVEDEIVIIEPRTRRVVEVISEPGRGPAMASRSGGQRVTITTEQRETLRQVARRSSSTGMTTSGSTTSGSTSPSGATLDANCLTLQAVPEELTRANPEFSNYKILAIGQQVVLIDPREQKVVEVVE